MLEAQRTRSLQTFVSQDMLLVVRPLRLTCNGARAYTARCFVRSSSCRQIWGRVIGHRECCGSEQGVHAKKWPQGRVSDGSAPFVVVAATLFVYTRDRQSSADVPRLLSLVWCEMRCLCWERAMCEGKAKKDAPAAVVSRAACVSRAPPADASRPALAGWGRPAWSLRVNLLSAISDPPAIHSFFVLKKRPPVTGLYIESTDILGKSTLCSLF